MKLFPVIALAIIACAAQAAEPDYFAELAAHQAVLARESGK